ncbi:MAG TPA: hypothetical protein VH678_24105 [Xanthobacteraceae bacterium]
MNDEEYKKLREDLMTARQRANARAKAAASAGDEKDNAVAARTPSAGEQLTATASN